MRRFYPLCLLIVLTACSSHKEQGLPPTNVVAFKIEPETIPAEFEFVGVTKSSHPVEIRSRVEGYLMCIDYVEGSMVNPGDPLFRIDPSQFEASLLEAKGILARQEAVLWRAKKSLARMEPLFEKNAVSERDLDNSVAFVLTSEAEVFAAQAKVTLAELNLSYTYINSPIKGLTGRAIYREGTLITPSINGLLTYVSVLDPIWVDFSVTESELLLGRSESAAQKLILPEEKNYNVKLQLADGTYFPYIGKLNFTSPILDPETGTMGVRATFENPQGELVPGQFVRAYVSGAFRPDAIYVPQQAVVQGKKGTFVYVIDKDNKVSQRNVHVGPWYKNYWVIYSGLQKGDVVVAEGVNKIQEGSSVHIGSFFPRLADSEGKTSESL